MKTCKACGCALVRNRYASGRIEDLKTFQGRQHCRMSCRASMVIPDVESRWGIPFWQVVSDFASQGLNRNSTARALGYKSPCVFRKVLLANPDKDPFEPFLHRPVQYFHESGERLGDALRRLAAQGHTKESAAREVGYGSGSALLYAMKARGIEIKFPRKGYRDPEKFLPRIRSMASSGFTVTQCCKALGFQCATRLHEYLRAHDEKITFSRCGAIRAKSAGGNHPWSVARNQAIALRKSVDSNRPTSA